MVTCMKKRVKIKSSSIRKDRAVPSSRSGWRSNSSKTPWLSPESRRGVNIKYNSFNQEHMVITCMQKRVNIKSNSMQEAVVVTCMKREGQGVEARAPLSLFLAVMVRLASMERFLQSISMSAISDVSTGHIFSLDFWTILLESKAYILSLSLTAANWGKFLKHWHAFEVSLSLFWNNSNVFSLYRTFTAVRTIQHFTMKR